MVAKSRLPVKHVPIVSDSQQVRVIFSEDHPSSIPFRNDPVWFQLEKSLTKTCPKVLRV
jgi:hypothetical protein